MIQISCSVCKSSYFLYNSETWTLHLKSSFLSVHVILFFGGYIWALHLTSWPSWTLHLKTWPNLTSVHVILFLGGYIWVLHLTSWPSCALHLKSWPNSAVSFEWALIDDIDQQRLHLLSITVLHGGYIRQLIWTPHLKVWTHFGFDSCFAEGFFVLHTKDLIIPCLEVLIYTSNFAIVHASVSIHRSHALHMYICS